jgi:hypothetical protein
MRRKSSIKDTAKSLLRQVASEIINDKRDQGYFRESKHIAIDTDSFLLSSVINGVTYRISGDAEKRTRNADGCPCVTFSNLKHDLRDNVMWHPGAHPIPDAAGQMFEDFVNSIWPDPEMPPFAGPPPFQSFTLHIYSDLQNHGPLRYCRPASGGEQWDPDHRWPVGGGY